MNFLPTGSSGGSPEALWGCVPPAPLPPAPACPGWQCSQSQHGHRALGPSPGLGQCSPGRRWELLGTAPCPPRSSTQGTPVGPGHTVPEGRTQGTWKRTRPLIKLHSSWVSETLHKAKTMLRKLPLCTSLNKAAFGLQHLPGPRPKPLLGDIAVLKRILMEALRSFHGAELCGLAAPSGQYQGRAAGEGSPPGTDLPPPLLPAAFKAQPVETHTKSTTVSKRRD